VLLAMDWLGILGRSKRRCFVSVPSGLSFHPIFLSSFYLSVPIPPLPELLPSSLMRSCLDFSMPRALLLGRKLREGSWFSDFNVVFGLLYGAAAVGDSLRPAMPLPFARRRQQSGLPPPSPQDSRTIGARRAVIPRHRAAPLPLLDSVVVLLPLDRPSCHGRCSPAGCRLR
jgi:hypothetical protein